GEAADREHFAVSSAIVSLWLHFLFFENLNEVVVLGNRRVHIGPRRWWNRAGGSIFLEMRRGGRGGFGTHRCFRLVHFKIERRPGTRLRIFRNEPAGRL